MYKTPQLRTAFRSCDVEKKARRCGAKHISKSKCFYKAHHCRTTFGSCDVEEVHAVVARSTFPSQNVQSTHMFAPLLEVRMLNKCTSLWREAHFEGRKHTSVRPLLEVETSKKCMPLWRQNVQNTNTTLHNTTFHYTSLHYHYTTLNYTTTTTTLHYTPLH